MNIAVRPNPKSILRGEWARFIFISGRLCIDFTQTGGETGKRAAWERFYQPSDLADWLSESPLQMQVEQISPEEFQVALSLREAIWRVAQALRQSEAPLIRDIETINRVAARPDLPRRLAPDSLQQVWHSPSTASAVLSLIARDAIDLFSGELRSRIPRMRQSKLRADVRRFFSPGETSLVSYETLWEYGKDLQLSQATLMTMSRSYDIRF